MNDHQKPVIGITMGDINGIGPEVIIKALNDNRLNNMVTPVIFGSGKILSYYRKSLNLEDFNYNQIRIDDHINHRKINVVNCWNDHVEIKQGEETAEGGKYALISLQKGVEALKSDKIDAIVTAPINKNNIQSEEFDFPGHTEFFTEQFNAMESLMFLVSDVMRIGVVTGHIPLKDVSDHLSKRLISEKLKIMLKSLKNDFGIQKPRVAILGLNPHAGEDGLLGKEEIEIINPVVQEFKDKGHLVFGSYSPDGFFGTMQYRNFDGILAMYHDQGLIPFKTLAFESGVNYSAGLPVIRTSPDHGTAYNIAGKNLANESSMREAIFLAADILKNRKLQAVD